MGDTAGDKGGAEGSVPDLSEVKARGLVVEREWGQGAVVRVRSSWLDNHSGSFPPERNLSMQGTFRRNLSALVSRKISGN